MEIDGDSRLYEDLEVKCFDNPHFTLAFSIGLPALILWGLGIPASALIAIVKNRHKLERKAIKSKFGFLYNGYRYPGYYWEFVIIYRKVAIIFI